MSNSLFGCCGLFNTSSSGRVSVPRNGTTHVGVLLWRYSWSDVAVCSIGSVWIHVINLIMFLDMTLHWTGCPLVRVHFDWTVININCTELSQGQVTGSVHACIFRAMIRFICLNICPTYIYWAFHILLEILMLLETYTKSNGVIAHIPIFKTLLNICLRYSYSEFHILLEILMILETYIKINGGVSHIPIFKTLYILPTVIQPSTYC